jgi:hypothetical protein
MIFIIVNKQQTSPIKGFIPLFSNLMKNIPQPSSSRSLEQIRLESESDGLLLESESDGLLLESESDGLIGVKRLLDCARYLLSVSANYHTEEELSVIRNIEGLIKKFSPNDDNTFLYDQVEELKKWLIPKPPLIRQPNLSENALPASAPTTKHCSPYEAICPLDSQHQQRTEIPLERPMPWRNGIRPAECVLNIS